MRPDSKENNNRNNCSISKSQDLDQSAELVESAGEKRRAEKGERREERGDRREKREASRPTSRANISVHDFDGRAAWPIKGLAPGSRKEESQKRSEAREANNTWHRKGQ